MNCICYDCFVLACILASLSLPASCTDEVVSSTTASDLVTSTPRSVAATTIADLVTTTTTNFAVAAGTTADWVTTSTTTANFGVATGTTLDFVTTTTTTDSVVATGTTADWITTTTTTSHGVVEGRGGSGSRNFEKESLEERDCTAICSEHRSDESDHGKRGRWHKSNGTWNGTFEHEAVEGEWHRHNGTWNGTFEREDVKGEWLGSHNDTLNKSFDRESGEGKWHRNPNGTRSSHSEGADGKLHEINGMHHSNEGGMAYGTREGKAKCDCRERSGAKNGIDAAGHTGMGSHRGGSDHDDGGDRFRSAAQKDEQPPQTEGSTSNNDDQDNGGSGLGNAAILGLAGAGIAAFCVASSVLLIWCRRSGKVPLTSGSVVFGKSVDNVASSDPGVVAGEVVTNV